MADDLSGLKDYRELGPEDIAKRRAIPDAFRKHRFESPQRDYAYRRTRFDRGVELPDLPEDPHAEVVKDDDGEAIGAAYTDHSHREGRKLNWWEMAKGNERDTVDTMTAHIIDGVEALVAQRPEHEQRAFREVLLNMTRGFLRAELPNANLTDEQLNRMTLDEVARMRAVAATERVYAPVKELNRPVTIGE